MPNLSFKTEAIVLKRTNYKEADRLVTLYTKEKGKLIVIAKGVRKLNSKNKGSLEIATHGYFYLAPFHEHLILTQTQVIESFAPLSTNLKQMTQAQQLLEIVHSLTVESEANSAVFDELLQSLNQISFHQSEKHTILQHIHAILFTLGFADVLDTSETRLQSIIEELIDHPLRTKKYLTPSYLTI